MATPSSELGARSSELSDTNDQTSSPVNDGQKDNSELRAPNSELPKDNFKLQTPNSELSLSVALQAMDKDGLYQATLPPGTLNGAYKITLEDSKKWSEEDKEISTYLFVNSLRKPKETAVTASTKEIVEEIARRSGGKVVMPHEAETLKNAFGEKNRTITEELEIAIWNNKWLLILLLLIITAEWIIRKRNGLV